MTLLAWVGGITFGVMSIVTVGLIILVGISIKEEYDDDERRFK